jgi:hypothetical protein
MLESSFGEGDGTTGGAQGELSKRMLITRVSSGMIRDQFGRRSGNISTKKGLMGEVRTSRRQGLDDSGCDVPRWPLRPPRPGGSFLSS